MDEARLRMLLGSALVDEPVIRPVAENVLRAGIRRRRSRRVRGVAGGAAVAALIAVVIGSLRYGAAASARGLLLW